MKNLKRNDEELKFIGLDGFSEIESIFPEEKKQPVAHTTKTKKSKIRKWDEVSGAVETEIEELAALSEEEPGSGPSISRNPMRNIEDMIEQNDNSFDGVINNLPDPKPAAQMSAEHTLWDISCRVVLTL